MDGTILRGGARIHCLSMEEDEPIGCHYHRHSGMRKFIPPATAGLTWQRILLEEDGSTLKPNPRSKLLIKGEKMTKPTTRERHARITSVQASYVACATRSYQHLRIIENKVADLVPSPQSCHELQPFRACSTWAPRS